MPTCVIVVIPEKGGVQFFQILDPGLRRGDEKQRLTSELDPQPGPVSEIHLRKCHFGRMRNFGGSYKIPSVEILGDGTLLLVADGYA